MWTIIGIINIAILIEILNYCASSKRSVSSKTERDKSSHELTYNLTINQINNIIDNRLKTLLEQQNDLPKTTDQENCVSEKKIENLTQKENFDHANSPSPNQKPPMASANVMQSNTSSSVISCSLRNDFETDIHKNKTTSVLTSTLSVVAAVSLAAVSLEQQSGEKT